MISALPSTSKRIVWWSWLGLLVAIPITSFPLVQETIGGETVAPLSILPMLLILAVGLLPYIVRGGRLPAEVQPILVFVGVATVATLASQFLPLDSFMGVTPLQRSIRGLSTLLIGVGFYLCASVLPDENPKMQASLRAIYLAGVLMLLWASVQAFFVLGDAPAMPWRLNQIHRFFSIRDLFSDRVTGFAYEPSWFGNQLAMLYLPLWLASIVTGHSVLRKPGSYPWESLILAIWGAIMLGLAKSRVSMVSMILMLGLLSLVAFWRLVDRIRGSLGKGALPTTRARSALVRLGTGVAGLVVLAGLLIAFVYIGSKFDWRIRRVLTMPRQLEVIRYQHPYETVYAVADRAAFAERLVYWRAGYAPFERYPLLGVGLGNAGFLFEEGVPSYGHQLIEIQKALDPANETFPNPKNLWIRILSETGLVGLATFITWMLVLGFASYKLFGAMNPLARVLGLAGFLGLAAWMVEGLSLDTFALPQAWILCGLLTAKVSSARPAMGQEGGDSP